MAVANENSATVDNLTGLRGMAALWVVIYHAWVLTLPLSRQGDPLLGFNLSFLSSGWVGVHILFVLSGFLLFLPFAAKLLDPSKTITLSHYFKRRVFRILPAYYVQLIILTLFALVGIYGAVPSMENLSVHFLMVHNFSPSYAGAINGVYWTLAIEFSFYFVLPLLFLFIRRYGWGAFFLCVAAVTLLYKYIILSITGADPVMYKLWLLAQLPGRISLFAYGMLAAFFYQKYRQKIQDGWPGDSVGITLTFASIVGLLIILFLIGNLGDSYWSPAYEWAIYVWDDAIGIVSALLLIGLLFQGRFVRCLFANRFMLFAGTVSYSIYLWHFVLLNILLERTSIRNYLSEFESATAFWLMMAMLLPLTLVVSAISYWWVERPFLKMSAERGFKLRFPLPKFSV